MAQEKITPRLVNAFVIAVCLLGFFLRLYFYGINRSLWLDEAKLALNLVNRSFLDLFNPLDYNQGAPVGFLILEKVVIFLLGGRDYILRLIPLIAGLASIPLMYSVSKRYSKGVAPFISLGLIAFSVTLIYYSSEVKQYSSDVLVTLLLLFLTPKCLQEKASPHAFVALGIMGVLAIWISHPALFMLAGILLTLGMVFAKQRDSYGLLWLIRIGVAWGINLILIYIISLRHLASNDALLNYWSVGFGPIPPWSDFGWYYDSLVDMLSYTAEFPFNALVVGLFILGVFSYAFKHWKLMSLLIIPIVATLIASFLRKYPFSGRMLLFILPILFLLISEGIERVRTILQKVNRPLALIIFISLSIYLLYTPIISTYKRLQSPPMGEHIKPVISYVGNKRMSTDLVYTYYGAGHAFMFYASLYGFERSDYILGISARDDPDKYLNDMNGLKGNGRVWFIFSHNCSWCTVNEKRFFLEHLNRIGKKKDEFIAEGASAYLYDLAELAVQNGKQIEHMMDRR